MSNGYLNGGQNADALLSEIVYLLQTHKKIDAIKLYREVTGASLADAKAAIENLERTGILNMGAPQPTFANPAYSGVAATPMDEIAQLLAQKQKIQAIKLYREWTGSDLATAKAAIDAFEMTGTLAMSNPQPTGTQSMNAAISGNAETYLAEIALLLTQKKKIDAIKLYRAQTGADLATAKNAVERIEQAMRTQGF